MAEPKLTALIALKRLDTALDGGLSYGGYGLIRVATTRGAISRASQTLAHRAMPEQQLSTWHWVHERLCRDLIASILKIMREGVMM